MYYLQSHFQLQNKSLPLEEQMISAMPDIRKIVITPEDEFMVLACDGIWNFMSSEKVIQFVKERIDKRTLKMSQICEEVCTKTHFHYILTQKSFFPAI